MNATQLVEFLKQRLSLCKRFSDERLRELAAGSRAVSFEAHEAVAHQGDEATHFFVVLSGRVSASVLGDGGTRQSLGQLKTGDTFGEMALMTEQFKLGVHPPIRESGDIADTPGCTLEGTAGSVKLDL